MQVTKKIKAFTLSEMLVVLVISGIIITITILVLGLVQGQIRNMQKNYNTDTEIRLLERALWGDFNKFNLTYNNSTEDIVARSEIDTVTYHFTNQYIVRNIDTIRTTVIKKRFFLDGNEVTSGAFDAIELQLSKEIKNKKLFIFKKNDATHYMN